MSHYKQGDIITMPYPFDDFSNQKIRPAVIVGKSKSRVGAYIVVKITTQIQNDTHSFRLENAFLSMPTVKPSEVRCNELLTVSEKVIIRAVSTLDKVALIKLCDKIKTNFDVG
jgi:mRNA-degrading endonuclease toxin of MazEF toxin-antitoxin module